MSASIFTPEELERIEWFRNAVSSLREEMIRTYEVIYKTAMDEGIREFCVRSNKVVEV
jgi:hypothetical protein